MKLRTYVRIWVILCAVLTYESFALNHAVELSILNFLKINGILGGLNLSPQAGKTVSLWLGWGGIGLMLLTNLYVLRKRLPSMKNLGRASRWLDFHIFCGLLGPTLILFHTNFKIGGLVAVSFWSMMVSFASGIVGRYFFLQLVTQRSDLERKIKAHEKNLEAFQSRMGSTGPIGSAALAMAGVPVGNTPQAATSNFQMEREKTAVLLLSGAQVGATEEAVSLVKSMANSLLGDLRLRYRFGSIGRSLPENVRHELKEYALTKRRLIYLEPFRKLMGYWHSFHMPFAVFMYLVAVIHIVTALLFKV